MTDPTANSDQPKTVTPDMPAAPPWPEHDWHLTEQPITEMDDRGKVTTVWPQTSERDAHLGAYVRDARRPPRWHLEADCPATDDGWHECIFDSPHGGQHHDCVCECGNECRTGRPRPSRKADPAPCTTAEQQLACPWRWAYNEHIGAPAGLTAAQEIRLRLVELTDWSQCTNSDQFDMQWSNSLHALRALAAWAENGDDETPHLRDWAPACPDPAIHDADLREAERVGLLKAVVAERDLLAQQITDHYAVRANLVAERNAATADIEELEAANRKLAAERCPDPALHEEDWVKHKYGQVADANADAAKAEERVAELKTELLEAHADLEASRAREQIAAGRIAELRPLVLELIGTDNENGLAGTTPRMLRAILAGDQDEGQRSAAIKAHELAETKADLLFVNGTHHYWSTHCRHGHHDRCAATELAPGVPRNPAQCKTCAAPCRCECHSDQGEEA